MDDMRYQACLLLGPDNALLGVVVHILNISEDTPLVVTNGNTSVYPFIAFLRDSNDNLLKAGSSAKKASGRVSIVKRTLSPGTKETHFMPVQELMPSGFDASKSEVYSLDVIVTMRPAFFFR